MLKLIIDDDEGRPTVVPFVREEITVGRQEGNTIRLTERNVSRRHARLLRSNGSVMVEDLGSYNGTRVNGEKISGKHPIHDGDTVSIGDYQLSISNEGGVHSPPPPAPPVSGEHQILPLSVFQNNTAQPAATTESEVEAISEADAQLLESEDAPATPRNTSLNDSSADSDASRRHSTAVIRIDQIEGNRARVVDIDVEDAPRLVILNTDYAGREFACIRSELKIGRTEENDIALDHRSLSRTHAKIVREDNGDWRVIDMQSANGISINGEAYAQATLRSGDVLMLGHVRARFVGAGQEFTFVPGKNYDVAEPTSPKKKSRLPLMMGLGIGAVALLGVGAVVMKDRNPTTPENDPTKVAVTAGTGKPAVSNTPDATAVAVAGDPTPNTVLPTGTPDTRAPDVQVANMTEKLGGARQAIQEKQFDKAADILGSIKDAEGSRPKVVEDLLDQVNAEIMFKKNIGAAQKALDSGDVDEAQKKIDESEGTSAWASDLEKVKARLAAKALTAKSEEKNIAAAKKAADDARADKARRAAEEAAAASAKKLADKDAKASAAERLFEEGKAVFKSKQYPEAQNLFKKCLDTDPSFARCHMMLGTTYARMKNVEKGAFHYRQFVKLAPEDESAPKVRSLLEQYEASKKAAP